MTGYTKKMLMAYVKKMNSLETIKIYGKDKTKITSARKSFEFLQEFQGLDKEHFIVIHLNTKNEVVSREIVSIGIMDACIVHPREIFRTAIMQNAQRIILAHNHPSGDPTPSEEDLRMTRKLIDVGDLLGIEVLDHIIVGKDEQYYSYCGD